MRANSNLRWGSLQRSLTRLILLYKRYTLTLVIVVLCTLFLTAVGLLLWATSEWGINVKNDSVDYIRSARYLAQGIGLGRVTPDGQFRAMNHFPPLYPSLLAGFELFGIDTLVGARWLGAFLFGTNVFLIGLAIFRITQSFWATTTGALIGMLSPTLIEINLWAMSEPLFISLTLLTLLWLDSYLLHSRRRWFFLAALTAALAYLTRYIGLSIVATCAVALLWLTQEPILDRFRTLVTFLRITLAPNVAWLARNYLTTGSLTNRSINFHLFQPETIHKIQATVPSWLRPFQDLFLIGRRKIALAAAALVWFAVHNRLHQNDPGLEKQPTTLLARLLGLFAAFYIGLLVTSLLFFDALTPLDDRILSPIFVIALILAVSFTKWLFERTRQISPILGTLPLVLATLLVVSYVQFNLGEAAYKLSWSRNQGLGFSYSLLVNSIFVQTMRAIPPEYAIVTGNLDQFYFLTGRPAYQFPGNFDPVTLTPVENYDANLAEIDQLLERDDVALVFFSPDEAKKEFIRERYPGLTTLYEHGNGLIVVSDPFE